MAVIVKFDILQRQCIIMFRCQSLTLAKGQKNQQQHSTDEIDGVEHDYEGENFETDEPDSEKENGEIESILEEYASDVVCSVEEDDDVDASRWSSVSDLRPKSGRQTTDDRNHASRKKTGKSSYSHSTVKMSISIDRSVSVEPETKRGDDHTRKSEKTDKDSLNSTEESEGSYRRRTTIDAGKKC